MKLMIASGRAYCGKILRVDLTDRKIHDEALNYEWAEQFIGGKGLGIRYLFDLLPPRIDPYSPENVIILMTSAVIA